MILMNIVIKITPLCLTKVKMHIFGKIQLLRNPINAVQLFKHLLSWRWNVDDFDFTDLIISKGASLL